MASSNPDSGKSSLYRLSLMVGILVSICFVLTASVHGQQDEKTVRPAFIPSIKANAFTPLELLEQFNAPEEADYTLGEGDEITVDIWDHPELGAKLAVGPDGKITIAQAGVIRVAGLTRENAAETISTSLSRYYIGPIVTVRVDNYVSNHVMVLGRVMHPGILQFETTPTLLEAVTRAGGLPVGGSGAEKAALARCAIFRGRDKIVWIELRNLLNGSNLALNLRLQRNDIIYIPDSDDQLVYVMGQVKTPGAYRLTPSMSFIDAIALAGGPTIDAKHTVHLVRPSEKLEVQVSFDDLIKPRPDLNFSLKEGDIIY
ncbi:MAG TPA: polysaccharide biosynthesis/export family protein, partial [Pyrinomonadaceae bacterium]|nr:polysaccharide biosynthesis/export family protein [Pyrinomonadaceae bacterium]